MKEVTLHIELAQDGSGWAFNQDFEGRTAYVYKTPEESHYGYGYGLVVPLTKEERENYEINIITKEGVTGLNVPHAKERYFDEE